MQLHAKTSIKMTRTETYMQLQSITGWTLQTYIHESVFREAPTALVATLTWVVFNKTLQSFSTRSCALIFQFRRTSARFKLKGELEKFKDYLLSLLFFFLKVPRKVTAGRYLHPEENLAACVRACVRPAPLGAPVCAWSERRRPCFHPGLRPAAAAAGGGASFKRIWPRNTAVKSRWAIMSTRPTSAHDLQNKRHSC